VSLSTQLLVTFGECLMTIMWFMVWLLLGWLHSTLLEKHYIYLQDWIEEHEIVFRTLETVAPSKYSTYGVGTDAPL
jgi:hypothetical protein